MTSPHSAVHEIHTSERKSFRACRWRWGWLFKENFYPQVTAKPLEFGVAYHEALALYYNPISWDWPPEVRADIAIAKFVKICDQQRRAFLEQTAQYYLPEEAQADYDERIELGKGMLKYHLTVVAPPIDKEWRPIKVEVPFQVPIVEPGTHLPLMCNNLNCLQHPGVIAPVVFSGRIDCIMENLVRGDYFVVDWKTAAQVHTDQDEFLYLDDQVMSYVWAMRVIGVPARGFVYHEQKKAFPEPPHRNATPRKGRMYSVNKQQNTSYEMYLETVKTEDTEAHKEGLYDEFLNYLQEEGNHYWQRYVIYKSDEELKSCAKNIYLEARDMVDPDLPMYPNPGRFGCTTCAFRQPCLGRMGGEDYHYTLETMFEKRKNHYWVKESSTETRGQR